MLQAAPQLRSALTHACPLDDEAICHAARAGHDIVVVQLLAAGADVHTNRDVALCVAAARGHDAVIVRLLAAGADVHANDDDALRSAVLLRP